MALWTRKQNRSRIRQVQKSMIAVTIVHNVFVVLIGLDYNCIRGLWTPGQLLIIFNLLLQMHHGTCLLWWRILSQIYLADSWKGDESIVFSLSPGLLITVYVIFLLISTASDVLCILFDSIAYESITILASCAVMLFVSYYTSVFVGSMQDIREATQEWKLGRSQSLLGSSNSSINSIPRVNRRDFEKYMKFGVKALIVLAIVFAGVGIADIFVAQPLDKILKVQNPHIFKLSWFIPPFLLVSMSLSTMFLALGWLPICPRGNNARQNLTITN
jgi:hypothetical protein